MVFRDSKRPASASHKQANSSNTYVQRSFTCYACNNTNCNTYLPNRPAQASTFLTTARAGHIRTLLTAVSRRPQTLQTRPFCYLAFPDQYPWHGLVIRLHAVQQIQIQRPFSLNKQQRKTRNQKTKWWHWTRMVDESSFSGRSQQLAIWVRAWCLDGTAPWLLERKRIIPTDQPPRPAQLVPTFAEQRIPQAVNVVFLDRRR
jgi:hypothetical protein